MEQHDHETAATRGDAEPGGAASEVVAAYEQCVAQQAKLQAQLGQLRERRKRDALNIQRSYIARDRKIVEQQNLDIRVAQERRQLTEELSAVVAKLRRYKDQMRKVSQAAHEERVAVAAREHESPATVITTLLRLLVRETRGLHASMRTLLSRLEDQNNHNQTKP